MNTSILAWTRVGTMAGLAMACGCLGREGEVLEAGAKDVGVEDASATDGGAKDAAAKEKGAEADTETADDGPTCTLNSDCGSDKACLFVPGDCSATGHCLNVRLLGSQCKLVVTWCGCDGGTIQGVCGVPYAYGPTLGTHPLAGPEYSCGTP
jgi:hypothetical protein